LVIAKQGAERRSSLCEENKISRVSPLALEVSMGRLVPFSLREAFQIIRCDD